MDDLKKYELTSETKVLNSTKLYRIKALKDFGVVKAGRIGGWVQKERNLSQYGDCWIDGNACVYNDARVIDNALVYENAYVFDKAWICGEARICGDARIASCTLIRDNACIWGRAILSGNILTGGGPVVGDNVRVFEDAQICGNVRLQDNAQVFGDAYIRENVNLYGDVQICGKAHLYGNAMVHGGVWKTAPLYIQGSKYSFNVSSEKTVNCGCMDYTWDTWSKKYQAIAKLTKNNNIINEYVQYFNKACEMYGHQECIITLS